MSAANPKGCYPYAAPMQVTCLAPVDQIANLVTGHVWSQLPPKSVFNYFNYYRLVSVQWPNSAVAVAPGALSTLGDSVFYASDYSFVFLAETVR